MILYTHVTQFRNYNVLSPKVSV